MDVTISSEDSLKVDVTLSEDGIVYCAALSSTEYISQWSIRQNGFISHTQSGMASVSINGVPPGAQVHVYCATFSYNGDAMSEANIRSTLVRVNMPCCRRLEADVVSDYMPGAGEVTDVMTISLQSPPSQDVTVTVSAFYMGSNFTNTSDDRRLQTFNASSALTPSEIKYTANSSLSELEKTIMFVADVEGNYEFNITLSGSSGEEYAVTFPSGKNVHVLPVYHLPPAPIISYARFVSDGSLLLVKFTSPTNKGDLIDTSFSCDQVLSFSHASSASCSWENSYRLSISLGPLSTLTVGDIVSIQPNVITGRCIYADTTICSSLEHSPPSSTPVTSAVTGYPKVVVTAPSKISNCSLFTLDLTSSTGAGGRAWSTVSITARSTTADVDAINFFFNSSYIMNPPSAIPIGLLKASNVYTIEITLCNFLGRCGSDTHRIEVARSAPPSVSIVGPRSRTMRRYQTLSVHASVFYDACLYKTSAEFLTLYKPTYEWTVLNTKSREVMPNMVSTSKSPNKFLLPAYSLAVGMSVEITVVIRNSLGVEAGRKSILVEVLPSTLNAVLSGGLEGAVEIGKSLVLNASESQDPDVLDESESSGRIHYHWSCVSLVPGSEFVPCGSSVFNYSEPSSVNAALASVRPPFITAINTLFYITLTVTDSSGLRSDETTIKITTVSSGVPIVSVSPIVGVVNPATKLKVLASITSTFSGLAQWLVNDESINTLKVSTTSPTRYSIPNEAVNFPSNLAISANSLSGNVAYIFKLSFTYGSGDTTSSTIRVLTNSPPRPGSFSVSPSVGTELKDNFVFTASLWSDVDLPLTYRFGYLTPENTIHVVGSKSEEASATTILPRGSDTKDNELKCSLQTYDSLDSYSTGEYSVTVNPSMVPISVDNVSNTFETLIMLDDVDALENAISVYASVSSAVVCASAPNCTQLNRQACSTTAHTCGPCVSDEFIGVYGHHNSMCVVDQDVHEGDICSTDESCLPFMECQQEICVPVSKQCVNSCSDKGTCKYVVTALGLEVDSCLLSEPSCSAICVCDPGYYGADCSIDEVEMAYKTGLQETILCALQTLSQLQDATLSAIQSWIAVLRTLSIDPTKLSSRGSDCAVSAIHVILDSASDVDISVEGLEAVLNAIDAVSRFQDFYDFPVLTTEYKTDIITSLSNMLEKFCGVISSDMILGEYTFQSLKSKIRISAILVDSSDNFTLSIPQTSAELLASKETSYVSSIAPSTSGYCLVSFDAAMYDTLTPGLSANPLSIISASSETSRTNSSSILNISLQNIVPVDYGVVFNESVIEAVCTKDKFQTSEVYHCPDGSNYTFVCENVTGIFEIHCPKTTLVPVCNRVVGVDVVDSSCVVDIASSSLTSVNCICPSGAANSGSPPSSGGSEYVNAQFVAMTEFVLDDFVTTWRSAGDLTVGDVTRSWKVVVTLGFIACFGCCGVFYSDKADDEVSKKEEIKKNAAQNIHGRAARPSNAPPTKDKVEIVESIFPAIFRNEPFVSVFIRELKQSHRWVSLVYHYTPEFPRVLRALSLVCAVISTMFFNALLYNLVNPDDGSCKGIDNKNECLEERSPFSSHESKCYFDSEASTCHFREPSDSTQAIFIVAVVCAMLSLPLVVVLEIVIIEILAKPTENSNESAVVPINSDVSRHQGTQGVQAPKRMAMFSNKFRNNQVGVKNSEDKISKRATIAGGLGVSPRDELIDMISKIDKYRASLSPKQLREFDMAWGIDVSMAKELLQMDDVPVSTTGRMRSLMAANKSVMGPLLSDIRSVRETVVKEIQTMSMLSDEARGRRILFLFQQDLLLGAKGKIVERKGIGNGSGQVKTVSAYVKFMGWAFIILFNMALLFYVFLFALNQSENRQNAWLQSFLLWLFFEVVIVSTACMVISQMIIPSLIFSEVSRIKRNVVYAVENYKAKLVNQDSKEPSKDDDGQFNACDYLFVSTRVARGFPHLFESGVVMGFRTPLPKRTYRRDKSTANTYRGKLRVTAFINSMSVLLLFMFGLLMNLPAPMEQMFFSLVNWSLFGYIGLLHVVLFETNPGYVVVPLLIAIAIFGPIVYYNYRAIDRAHRLQAEQIEGKWYQDQRLSRCRPPFVSIDGDFALPDGKRRLLRSCSDLEKDMSPVAADTDEFNFEEQRARDIVIAMQKMVGEHDTGFGQLSGDEYDNDAQERRKQPKLRAILQSLGMMDRLRDLDLSDDDKDERKEGTLSSDNKVTLENSDLDSQSIHSLERFSSEEDTDTKRRHRPEEEIVGYMGHMVQEGQALFGATSDDFDNDETQESTKLAALLKKKGMMDKLFELSSSGEDDGEEAKQHREHRRTYRAARMTRLGRHMDKKSVVGDSSIQGPSLAATMGARKVIRNFRQRRQKGRPESEVVGYMKRMVRENEVELGEVLGEFTDKLDRAESDRQGLHLASKLRTNGMLEKLYDLSSTSSDGSDSSEAPELETNAVSRGEDRSLPNVHRPEDEDVSYMKRMVIEHDVTLGALSGEEDEQSGGAATPRKLPKLAAKLKADGMMDKLFELSSSSGEEVEGRSAGANRAERRRLRKATRLAKNNSKFPSSKDKESLLRESAVYSASGSKVGMIQALDQAPSSISGDDSDVAITIREPDNHQWGGQRVVGVDGGPLIINTLERIGEGSAEEGYGEFTGIPDSNNTIDVDSEATSESSSHNSEINNEVTCTSEVKPNNKLRSQKSIDRDDVVAAKKKFAMGLAGKDVSMKFRESDARSRLEQRLQNKKGKNANTAENLSTETRGASMTSKDLVKKLTVNTTRHRMSMTTRHDAAKLRLQDRLNDRKREVNMK